MLGFIGRDGVVYQRAKEREEKPDGTKATKMGSFGYLYTG